ncbi:gamma-glutamyl-phosphate reductase, partial [bacterium]|nr:gamma-glutamyl-phosphate reductase [bacterium]
MPDSPVAQAARQARAASLELAALSIGARNSALEAMACALEEQRESVLAENQKDLTASEQMIVRGDLTAANAKRLDLRGSKFDGVVEGLRSVAALPDPIGRVLMATEMDEGLDLYRVSCPIGVIAV